MSTESNGSLGGAADMIRSGGDKIAEAMFPTTALLGAGAQGLQGGLEALETADRLLSESEGRHEVAAERAPGVQGIVDDGTAILARAVVGSGQDWLTSLPVRSSALSERIGDIGGEHASMAEETVAVRALIAEAIIRTSALQERLASADDQVRESIREMTKLPLDAHDAANRL